MDIILPALPKQEHCRKCDSSCAPDSVFCYVHRTEALKAGICWNCGDAPIDYKKSSPNTFCITCKQRHRPELGKRFGQELHKRKRFWSDVTKAEKCL